MSAFNTFPRGGRVAGLHGSWGLRRPAARPTAWTLSFRTHPVALCLADFNSIPHSGYRLDGVLRCAGACNVAGPLARGHALVKTCFTPELQPKRLDQATAAPKGNLMESNKMPKGCIRSPTSFRAFATT